MRNNTVTLMAITELKDSIQKLLKQPTNAMLTLLKLGFLGSIILLGWTMQRKILHRNLKII